MGRVSVEPVQQRGAPTPGGGLPGWWRRHAGAVDTVLVLVTLPVVWLATLASTGTSGGLALLVVTVTWLPLAWRRRAPAEVAGVVATLLYGQVLVLGATDLLLPNGLVVVAVMFTVTAYARRDLVWQAYLALALVGCVLVGALGATSTGVVAGTTVLGATLAGYLRRIVRVRDEAAVERARRLEVERDSTAAVAAAEERRRIARDLHDVIAHSLTVIVAQADGGRYAARTDPAAAAQALATVSATGRAALGDLRAALGALRGTDGASTDPLPGLADVPALVEQVRGSGTPVRLTLLGDPATVPPAAGLTAYRVVQESLTNALKHAGPGATVDVDVACPTAGPATGGRPPDGPAEVRVTVLDDGLGSAAAKGDGGMGVPSMRERVRALGGELEAGPRAGGGWAVRARLPLSPDPAGQDAGQGAGQGAGRGAGRGAGGDTVPGREPAA